MPWWTLLCTASHDPGQRIDWGWQTDMRSHNSGYKNRGFCWLIVMTEYDQLTAQQLCHYAAVIFRTLQCCSLQGRTLVYCHRMLVTTCGDAPGVWLLWPGVVCRGPHCPGVMYPCPAQDRPSPASGGPGPSSSSEPSRPVECQPARGEQRTPSSQVSALYTLRRQASPRGILSHFLHFCILLICQYLLSADKHRPRSTKEVLVRTAPIELY